MSKKPTVEETLSAIEELDHNGMDYSDVETLRKAVAQIRSTMNQMKCCGNCKHQVICLSSSFSCRKTTYNYEAGSMYRSMPCDGKRWQLKGADTNQPEEKG